MPTDSFSTIGQYLLALGSTPPSRRWASASSGRRSTRQLRIILWDGYSAASAGKCLDYLIPLGRDHLRKILHVWRLHLQSRPPSLESRPGAPRATARIAGDPDYGPPAFQTRRGSWCGQFWVGSTHEYGLEKAGSMTERRFLRRTALSARIHIRSSRITRYPLRFQALLNLGCALLNCAGFLPKAITTLTGEKILIWSVTL